MRELLMQGNPNEEEIQQLLMQNPEMFAPQQMQQQRPPQFGQPGGSFLHPILGIAGLMGIGYNGKGLGEALPAAAQIYHAQQQAEQAAYENDLKRMQAMQPKDKYNPVTGSIDRFVNGIYQAPTVGGVGFEETPRGEEILLLNRLKNQENGNPKLTPQERAISAKNYNDLQKRGKSAKQALKSLNGYKEAFKELEESSSSFTQPGDTLRRVPYVNEALNAFGNKKQKTAVDKILKGREDVILSILGTSSDTRPTDVLKREIAAAVPTEKIQPEAANKFLDEKLQQAKDLYTESEFMKYWKHIHGNLTNADVAFDTIKDQIDLVDAKGGIKKDALRQLPELVKKLSQEIDTDQPENEQPEMEIEQNPGNNVYTLQEIRAEKEKRNAKKR